MVHFPFVWWCKIGITSRTAKARAKQVDRAVRGKPIPIMAVWIPGAWHIEQDLHRRFSAIRCRFYSGDGSSEWFWFPAALIVYPLMWAVWAAYLNAVDFILGTGFFPMCVEGVLWAWDFVLSMF